MRNSLEVVGVSYRYPKADADVLHRIDLSFPAGSFTVVMGQTGAGKSTLLMTLNGVIPHLKEGSMQGKVVMDGQDLSGFRVQTITRYVGLVLQDAESQILGRSVAEDVAFGPRNYLVDRDEIRARVLQSLRQVQLDGFDGRETSQLSGGQKQRLAIAGILALRPRVICLDEPTSELDPQGRDEIYATVDVLRRAGEVTIVAVEHGSGDIVGRADHLVAIKDGRVSWQGPPSEFFRDLDLVTDNRVKPLPIAVVGAGLATAGLIESGDIPLSVDDAEALIRRLASGSLPAAPPPPGPAASTVGGPVVELRQLVHTYDGGHRGLAEVDLTIGRGEFVAIVGRNGAGKTTLAKHLNRLLDPTSGTVLINGINTATLTPAELARHVGYVFQNPDHQIFNTSVGGEVGYGLKLAGLSDAEIDTRIGEALDVVGLTARRNEHPFSLGKGERQRVAVASVLALRPEILVVDEPTTGQDWAGVQSIMALIGQLNRAGTTIVMITHDMDVVAHHARRVIVMNDGRIAADGPTADVLARTDVLASAAVATTQPVDLSLRLWPQASPILDEAELGEHLADELVRTRLRR